jgi:hypothetical protein
MYPQSYDQLSQLWRQLKIVFSLVKLVDFECVAMLLLPVFVSYKHQSVEGQNGKKRSSKLDARTLAWSDS